jgi:uncharacterized membrane protein YuzA (DUF378 family)
MRLPNIDTMALFLLIIGGLNAGVSAVFEYNVIGELVGGNSNASTVVYALIGLSACYMLAGHMGWTKGRSEA